MVIHKGRIKEEKEIFTSSCSVKGMERTRRSVNIDFYNYTLYSNLTAWGQK